MRFMANEEYIRSPIEVNLTKIVFNSVDAQID